MEEIVSLCRDGTFCQGLTSIVISMCFPYFGFMVNIFRLHVNGIPDRRDVFRHTTTQSGQFSLPT